MIQIYIDCFNKKTYKIPNIIRSLIGREKINLKMIYSDGSVLRTGFYIENGTIAKAVEGGLRNPTVTIAATESAIDHIESSRDIIGAANKEIKKGSLSIKGKTLGANIKLNVLFSGASAAKTLDNI